jgi:hypothetical protein
LHGNWNAAITALVDKRGLGSLWKPPVPTTKLMQRQIALQLCGWDLKEDELKTAIRNWERRGQLSRAACWLVFTKQHGKAMELLMKSDGKDLFGGTVPGHELTIPLQMTRTK